MYANRLKFRIINDIGIEEHEGGVRFLDRKWKRPFRACAMHPAIIIGRVRSLWTYLWSRYNVPQNVFLVIMMIMTINTPCRITITY